MEVWNTQRKSILPVIEGEGESLSLFNMTVNFDAVSSETETTSLTTRLLLVTV